MAEPMTRGDELNLILNAEFESCSTKCLLMVLDHFCRGKSWAPSMATLAKKTGTGERTVRRNIDLLVELGIVRRTRRPKQGDRHQSNLYRISFSGLRKYAKKQGGVGVMVTPSGGSDDTQVGGLMTPSGGSDGRLNEQLNEHKEREYTGPPESVAVEAECEAVESAWRASAYNQRGRKSGITSLRFLLNQRLISHPESWDEPARKARLYAESPDGKGRFCVGLPRFVKSEWEEDPDTWQQGDRDRPVPKQSTEDAARELLAKHGEDAA